MKISMIGFIGAGNMGQALIRSLLKQPHSLDKKNQVRNQILVYDQNSQVRKRNSHSGIIWCRSSKEVLDRSKVIFLCIKPKDVVDFFAKNRQWMKHQIIISIIAGTTITALRNAAKNPKLKVCRIMPNLAAAIGQGTGTVTYSRNISQSEKKNIQKILSHSGLYLETPESRVNAITAISGCGPAFVFLFIEALTQAAVDLKVPHKQALQYAVSTVIGAGSLLQFTGQKPLVLTSQVTSPGGMTIEGVNWLNQSEFHNLIKEAVFRAHAKAENLFKK